MGGLFGFWLLAFFVGLFILLLVVFVACDWTELVCLVVLFVCDCLLFIDCGRGVWTI